MDFFPVLTRQYWYFTIYFGTYLFLPIFNKGIENINKSQLKISLITLICIFIVLKDYLIPDLDTFRMHRGYSIVWYLIFYATGAYFGKYKEDRTLIKNIIYNIIYKIIFYYSTKLCFIIPTIKSGNQKFKKKIYKFFKKSIY